MSGDMAVRMNRMKSWRGRSGLAKVDTYTRVTAYMLLWVAVLVTFLICLTEPVRHHSPLLLVLAAPVLVLANGVLGHRFLRSAMSAYLRPGATVPRHQTVASAVAAALTAGAVLAESATAPLGAGGLPGWLGATLVPFFCGHSLVVRIRTIALHQALVACALLPLTMLTGIGPPRSVLAVVVVALCSGWLALTVRLSLWTLGVLWELREARDVQARLAVAEERLRFGRDLHDVMGRNLSVIALKSELAVQLARRGRPEAAVDQMTEVQRIARESQREVREVVRGYREADLRVELEGARGVLGAAGIVCTVDAPPFDLPAAVQSTLGWVVRETTTNVLRHGDARHCAITLRREPDGAVVLTVTNDGAGAVTAVPGAGSGLAGLRERLGRVGGELAAGPDGTDGTDAFTVTATVPRGEHPGAARSQEFGEESGADSGEEEEMAR
ncbi:sensor histidine kinase [Streptomyces sp. NPDC090025]|uniref:sensor histidine kinase n=1 Tax=Streptomyces sp. NPDC090025 TaxID=3365922 RepID=UPI00383292CF